MKASEALKAEAGLAFGQLEGILAEVDEPRAWACATLQPGAYLHTSGSILSIVQHIAVCKFIYGSAAFRSTELRWRDLFDRLDALGTSWADNRAYLDEAQAYWMGCWRDLGDEDLEREYMVFSGKMWPAWKVIATVTQHDAYHGAQIAMLGSLLAPASEPPDLDLEGERKYVVDLPTW